MNAITTTRRAALGAIAAAPIAVATGALAFTPAVANRAEWDCAMAEYKKASAAAAAFDRDVAVPAFDAWEKAQEQVPHVTTTSSFPNVGGGRTHFSTADPAIVAMARRMQDISDNADYVAVCRELIQADEARKSELERRRLECGYDAICDRSTALEDLESEAWHKLIAMPAPDGDALMWKMEELWGDEGGTCSGGWKMEIVNVVLADARRLLSVS